MNTCETQKLADDVRCSILSHIRVQKSMCINAFRRSFTEYRYFACRKTEQYLVRKLAGLRIPLTDAAVAEFVADENGDEELFESDVNSYVVCMVLGAFRAALERLEERCGSLAVVDLLGHLADGGTQPTMSPSSIRAHVGANKRYIEAQAKFLAVASARGVIVNERVRVAAVLERAAQAQRIFGNAMLSLELDVQYASVYGGLSERLTQFTTFCASWYTRGRVLSTHVIPIVYQLAKLDATSAAAIACALAARCISKYLHRGGVCTLGPWYFGPPAGLFELANAAVRAEEEGYTDARVKEEDDTDMQPLANAAVRAKEEDDTDMRPLANAAVRVKEEDDTDVRPLAGVVPRPRSPVVSFMPAPPIPDEY